MIYCIDYFGFVYIWYDKTRKMFCIGSHMGSIDDGYITTTGWMKRSVKKRPHDFKRRIIYWQKTPNDNELRDAEQKWLNLIKEHELGIRYYNLKKVAKGWPKGVKMSSETRKKMSIAKKGKPAHNKGQLITEEHKKKISVGLKKHFLNAPSNNSFKSGKENPAQAQRGTAYAKCRYTGKKLGRFPKDDPRWKTGEFVGLRFGVKAKQKFKRNRKHM